VSGHARCEWLPTRCSCSQLAVLAPNHLADGLELAVALDVRVEQGRHWRLRCPRGSSCSGVPTVCHLAASSGWISEEVWMQEQVGCTSSSGRGGGGDASMREEEVPSMLSFKVGRGGVVSKATSLRRRFKAPVTLCASHDLHATSSHQPRDATCLRPLHLHMAL
jgi:hypothetical protein